MLDKDLSLKTFHAMLRIRMVEERISELYAEQEMRCPVHLCSGQEAIPAGVCANLGREDFVFGNHRSHGHYLARGGSLKAMLAEIYGKASGCSGGKGGSMHLVDLSVNIIGTTPIVGGIIPVAVGSAFASFLKNDSGVTVVFLGRGSTEEGVFFESLNFAALKKLPVLFVSEDNLFSVYSPLNVRQSENRGNLALAKSVGVSGAEGDGNDVAQVFELTSKAMGHIRGGKGPYFLEFQTYRWREHCGPNFDNDLGYREDSEYLKWRDRCPVESFEKKLVASGVLDVSVSERMRKDIGVEIEQAFAFAKSSPFPEVGTMCENIYANGVSQKSGKAANGS
jgi:TPP-dependent pyruvate/acetoin dehydrogenase alpha subunit